MNLYAVTPRADQARGAHIVRQHDMSNSNTKTWFELFPRERQQQLRDLVLGHIRAGVRSNCSLFVLVKLELISAVGNPRSSDEDRAFARRARQLLAGERSLALATFNIETGIEVARRGRKPLERRSAW